MGWLTVSLRKLTMVQEVAQLEHRLTQLSQEEQSMSNHAAYRERALGSQKSEALKSLTSSYSQNLDSIAKSFGDDGTGVGSANSTFQELANYNVQIQQAQLDYLYQKAQIDSIFTQKEQDMQQRVNRKQSMLDTQQEQVETLLESARAEKEQLDQAVSQDIKECTISLV